MESRDIAFKYPWEFIVAFKVEATIFEKLNLFRFKDFFFDRARVNFKWPD